MPKALTVAGMVVAGLLLLLFGLDLAIKFPFNRAAGATVEILFIICAVMLGYISWSAFREQV